MGQIRATVGDVIKRILPFGTDPSAYKHVAGDPNLGQRQSTGQRWDDPPYMAQDLFAACAYLCNIGSVSAFFNPSPYEDSCDHNACEFVITRNERNLADTAVKEWNGHRYNENGDPLPPKEDFVPIVPQRCRCLWGAILKSWDDPINPGYYERRDDPRAPEWWSAALQLVMISDMACARLFRDKFTVTDKSGRPLKLDEGPFEKIVKGRYEEGKAKARDKGVEFRSPESLTYLIDTSLACVLPKIRVSPVGATMRNVSRNLALLPGSGEVRCYWQNLSSKRLEDEDNATLDILLIPEPRRLESTDFVAEENGGSVSNLLRKDKWNWDNFELRQTWIDTNAKRNAFIADCVELLLAAKNQSRNVNAVILPEYAIDYDLFENLCDKLKQHEPGLEFVIAGASDNCDGKKGNIVLTRVWDNLEAPSEYITDSRRKHHRWRMNRSQVETYALSSSLNPKIENWWENTPLGRRELNFHRFRKASVFSVLICEELARSDPCHEILRAVAPNLIFALLLDGPQIKPRWPAQYAANLADDPGSSVLTFTSYGLIERSNRQGHHDANHSVALWKDDTGRVVEIKMPHGTDGPRGVLLSLWPEHVKDITITGKRSEGRTWRYASHFPIVLDSKLNAKSVPTRKQRTTRATNRPIKRMTGKR